MVEYSLQLDNIFASLADPTRRDILRRVSKRQLNVNEIASSYRMSLAAVSKHLKVLEHAKLVVKRKKGKEQIVTIAPTTLKNVDEYLDFYRQFWEDKLESLDKFLKESKE